MLAIQKKTQKNVVNASNRVKSCVKACASVVSVLLVTVRWPWYLRRWSARFSILTCNVLGEEMELSFEFTFSKWIVALCPQNLNELPSAR